MENYNLILSMNPLIEELKNKFNKINICFILTYIPNPRIVKRINILKKIGDINIICIRRKKQNIFSPLKDINHIIFDMEIPSSNNIFKRFFAINKFKKMALKELNKIKPNVIYVQGLDCLYIASKYKMKRNFHIIYEVADLREKFLEIPKKFMDKFLTKFILNLEKKLFHYVNFLVITSPKFYDLHYNSLISNNKTIFMPNLPDVSIFSNYKKKKDGVFTIGFIGDIRYIKQMKMLVDASEIIHCNVLFAGGDSSNDLYKELVKYCNKKTNIRFFGKYDYMTQIANLYGQVDCVYSVYDADNPNVRIALPNKLYESIFCELPIIVSKNTYLEELVLKWNVGISVKHDSLDELIFELNKLMNDKRYYINICEKIKIKKKLLYEFQKEDII